MNQDKDEVRRLLDVLQTLMRMLAISNREVERRLDLKHGTVSRLLNGQIEAKLEVVIGVARALGLGYEELFSFAYPERPVPSPESEAARKIRSMLEDLRPMGATSKLDLAGPLDRSKEYPVLKKAVREVLEEMGKDRQKTGNGG